MYSYDVVEWGQPLQRREHATPVPTGTQVLLKLKFCGVCHSDVHIRDGYFDLGGGKKFHMSERGMQPPVTLGHEPFGTVLAAGPDAGTVPLGQDRLVFPWTGCGTCARCQQGQDNHCMQPRYVGIHSPGAYADHVLIPHPRYLIDASGIDPAWAATLSCSGLTTYSAVKQLGAIPPAETVAVIGAGGLGLATITALRALGHERIIVLDIDPGKLDAAKAAGALAVVDSRAADAVDQVTRRAGGLLFGVVDLVGSADTASLALSLLRKGGKLVLLGLFGGEIPMSTVVMVQRALTIMGSNVGTPAELRELVALAQAGKLKPLPLERRPLADVSRTLDQLKAGTLSAGRVVLQID